MKGFAVYEFSLPFGFIEIGYDAEYIVSIQKSGCTAGMGKRTDLTDRANLQIAEYLNGNRKEFDFPIRLVGTEFQMKVWEQLQLIPYGETRSYKEIAEMVGIPKAYRAVGMANNKNPIMIVVPCHRVIGSDGKMVGYGGGLDIKAALLKIEQRHR